MRPLMLAATLALALDQGFKYLVIQIMGLDRVRMIDVLPPLLNLRYGENRGVNFGLFGDGSDIQRWVLIAVSLAVMAGIAVWVMRVQADTGTNTGMQISAGLLIGGALGNVTDRVLHGYVIDFLNMSCCGINNPFVFNTADIFIFAGAAGLVFLDTAERRKKAP